MENQQRIRELDSLRALAALGVLLFHYSINENRDKLGWSFRYGVTGVDLFFIISGFVIYLSVNYGKDWREFLLFRFARLFPAYWSCMAVTAVFMYFYEPEYITFSKIVANATMVPAYFNVEDLDGSYWTIQVELLFYCWILFLLFSHKLGSVVKYGFVTIALVVFFHLFSDFYKNYYDFAKTKLQLIDHFPLFYSGILFYRIKMRENIKENVALLIFSILASLYLHDKGGRSMFFVSLLEHGLLITFYHLIFLLAVFGKLSFLKITPLVFLGRISYCLYLIHQYIGTKLIKILNEKFATNIYVALCLAIAFSLSVATLITYCIEIPCSRYLRSKFRERRQKLPINGYEKPKGIRLI